MQSRKSTNAHLRKAIAALEKVVIKLQGRQKEEVDLTQLLLLKQQEIADAKNDAAERAREVDCRRNVQQRSIVMGPSLMHGSSAFFSSPVSPQQWAVGLAASLLEDARIKVEVWYTNVHFEYLEVLSQVSPATPQQAHLVAVCCGRRARVRCGRREQCRFRMQATAGGRALRTSTFSRSARATTSGEGVRGLHGRFFTESSCR